MGARNIRSYQPKLNLCETIEDKIDLSPKQHSVDVQQIQGLQGYLGDALSKLNADNLPFLSPKLRD